MHQLQVIYLYGNDRRQKYLGSMLKEYGFTVVDVPSGPDIYDRHILQDEILMLPVAAKKEILNGIIPFIHSRTYIIGGILPNYLIDICNSEKARFLDYMKIPEIAIKNAVATAEGAICEAIKTGSINIHGSKCLVIGYGRCGTVLADKLNGLKAHIDVLSIEPPDIAKAAANGYEKAQSSFSDYDFIFNTAPALVITPELIDTMKSSCIIIDIASKPGGTDFEYCKRKNITAKHCLGLPAIYSPKTSAKIIFDEIIKYIAHSAQDWRPYE